MTIIQSLKENTVRNNRIIRLALRAIDTEVLAAALLDEGDEEQAVFLRNMSKRAGAILKEDLALKKGLFPAAKIEEAREFLLHLLENQAVATTRELEDEQAIPLPEITTGNAEEIIATFGKLAAFVRKKGYLPLEQAEETISHPVMRKGIMLLVDGWDPLIIKSILENYKSSYLLQEESKLNMIVEGIAALCYKEYPVVVEERLKAYKAG